MEHPGLGSLTQRRPIHGGPDSPRNPSPHLRLLQRRRRVVADRARATRATRPLALLRTEETSAEVARLRRCVNDLVSVLGLPMMWAGHEPSRVATTLLDVLVQMLGLDFGYLRVGDPNREPVSEWLRAAAGPSPDPAAVGHALETYLSGGVSWRGPRIAHPFAEGTVSIGVFHIGPSDRTHVFVAGSRRPDFPSETEHL